MLSKLKSVTIHSLGTRAVPFAERKNPEQFCRNSIEGEVSEQRANSPMKSDIPIIPNITQIIRVIIITWAIPPTEPNNVATTCFMLGNRWIVLSGRNALNALNALSAFRSIPVSKTETRDVVTTTKSKTFQLDFRYVWGPKMNPCEVMDITISTANIVVNTTSEISKNLRAVESSGTEGPSAARIKEFNKMAPRIKFWVFCHFKPFVTIFRNLLFGFNRKNDHCSLYL